MKYKVIFSRQAKIDLCNIFEYIALNLQAEQTARKQLARLEQAIKSLNEMPDRFRLYEKEPWHSRGTHIMPVGNYLVFYISDAQKHAVLIIRVFHGRQNYEKML